MRPAWSVVLLTTLIGVGQGLFAALFATEAAAAAGFARRPDPAFLAEGAAVSLAFTAAGLVASIFHLGRPERAWRAAAKWRTSWLSREVIALPLFMALVAAWGAAHFAGGLPTLGLGLVALAACLALFGCTGMVYACVRFLQEWASGWTLVNFTLMGCASGLTLAAAIAAARAPELASGYAAWAIAATAAAFIGRLRALGRNSRLRSPSTLQSAIGVAHPRIRQVSRGFTAGAFNTTEFFHGVDAEGMRRAKARFLLLAFLLPMALLALGMETRAPAFLAGAFAVQYAGLALERWYFLADSRHPQNLYYQSIA